MAMKEMLTKVPVELLEAANAEAKAMAKRTGLRTTRSDVVRIALEQYLREKGEVEATIAKLMPSEKGEFVPNPFV